MLGGMPVQVNGLCACFVPPFSVSKRITFDTGRPGYFIIILIQ